MKRARDVDQYIAMAPKEVQGKLKELRVLIRTLVPKVKESISYGMPYYGNRGRLVYFGAQKHFIGLYIPPPIIQNHEKELEGYVTTKSAVHLPDDKDLPVGLIKKLIKARIKYNKEMNV